MYRSLRKTWNFVKWLAWKTISIGGERWGNRIWMIYSLARIFIGAKILRTYVNEPEGKLLPKIIKIEQVCFDIGASIGTYTYLMSHLVGPKGMVYSFEPLPRSFHVL
jgi:hypothetical protein